MRPDLSRCWLAALVLLACAGLQGCASGRSEPPPKTTVVENPGEGRIDLQPVSARVRKAMGEGDQSGQPEGAVSLLLSLDKDVYRPFDEVWVTALFVNNTERPVRICRRLFLGANFDLMMILNEHVRVLPNVNPPRPGQVLPESDFLVLPPFGEHSEVLNLKDLPRFGLARGQNVQWAYNVRRPGTYWLVASARSVPYQLVPESLRGDPTARLWEGSLRSNVVQFRVRRR